MSIVDEEDDVLRDETGAIVARRVPDKEVIAMLTRHKKEPRMRAVISAATEKTLKAMSETTGKPITQLIDELITCAINRRAAAMRWQVKNRGKGKAKKKAAK